MSVWTSERTNRTANELVISDKLVFFASSVLSALLPAGFKVNLGQDPVSREIVGSCHSAGEYLVVRSDRRGSPFKSQCSVFVSGCLFSVRGVLCLPRHSSVAIASSLPFSAASPYRAIVLSTSRSTPSPCSNGQASSYLASTTPVADLFSDPATDSNSAMTRSPAGCSPWPASSSKPRMTGVSSLTRQRGPL